MRTYFFCQDRWSLQICHFTHTKYPFVTSLLEIPLLNLMTPQISTFRFFNTSGNSLFSSPSSLDFFWIAQYEKNSEVNRSDYHYNAYSRKLRHDCNFSEKGEKRACTKKLETIFWKRAASCVWLFHMNQQEYVPCIRWVKIGCKVWHLNHVLVFQEKSLIFCMWGFSIQIYTDDNSFT